MGGVPCAKVIINGRLNGRLALLLSESEISKELLRANSYNASQIVLNVIELEEKICETLDKFIMELRELNDIWKEE